MKNSSHVVKTLIEYKELNQRIETATQNGENTEFMELKKSDLEQLIREQTRASTMQLYRRTFIHFEHEIKTTTNKSNLNDLILILDTNKKEWVESELFIYLFETLIEKAQNRLLEI